MSGSLIFLVGPGGVGKTTISAAFGFVLRELGRTIVITIDPAKRLRSALSISIEGIRQIDENLFVTQVDKEKEFRRFAFQHGIGEIVSNRLFEIASDLLPSEEYSAGIKILDIYDGGDFEYIVVDTPPSVRFLSFLDAPDKILSMFRTNAVRYFLEAVATAGRRMSLPLAIAGRLLGSDFVLDFAKFLGAIRDVFGSMQKLSLRARDIIGRSVIVGVASPYDGKVDELLFMINEMRKRGVKVAGVVMNRFLDFSEDSFPSGAPEGVQEFHRKLVLFSRKMREGLSEIQRLGVPVCVIRDRFEDMNSAEHIRELSSDVRGFVFEILNKVRIS